MMQSTNGQVSGQITQQWLDQKLTQWRPTQNASLSFQALFSRASYGNPETSYNTMDVQNADLNMLVASNAGCIRIDIGYAPWLQKNQAAINEVTTLVQNVRAAGKCLVIADAGSETYRHGGQIPWTQFKQAWVQRVSTLAALYHPDYYIVIKEPGWYVDMVSDAATNPAFQNGTDWTNLTQTLASTVVSASPNTLVGVSVAADSLNSNPAQYVSWLTGVEKLSQVSILGFDVYTTSGFNATQSFLTTHGSAGKSVWLAEAWSGDGTFVFDQSRAQLDSEWMLVLYYFALTVHATAVMPFYTDLFASYSLTSGSPTDSAQIISLYQQRTPVFSEFRAIIASASGLSSSTTTASTTQSSSTSSTQTTQGRTLSTTIPNVSSSQSSTATQSQSSTATQSQRSSTASKTSSASDVRSTTGGSGNGSGIGFFSPVVLGLEALALAALVGFVVYLRRR